VAIAASAGRDAAAQSLDTRAAALEARRTRMALAQRRAELAVAQARLDSERAGIEALLTEQRARRATLSSLADAAGNRVRALAREARSLRDLVARSVASRRSTPASASKSAAAPVSRASLTRLTPAAGEVVRRFGQTSAAGTAAGMTIRTRPGAQVLAPSAATISYAGPFRGYGNVLILDVGNDYAVVLTGSSSLLATAGQRVLAGQPVAEMGRDASSAPELYVEVRRSGQPVDPGRWLAAGR
jgi:septal ring factor EnvC (AmiA/AmiB activator)